MTEQQPSDAPTRLNLTSVMQLPLGFNVRGVRLVSRTKLTEIFLLAIDSDYGRIAATVLTCAKFAASTRFSRCAEILHVYRVRHVAQIVDAIVRAYCVFVVNVPRPDVVDIEPCKSMSEVVLPIDSYIDVPVRTNATSNISDVNPARSTASGAVCENARLWIIVQQFAQTFGGKIQRSHAASVIGHVVRALATFPRCGGSPILGEVAR